MHCCIFGCTNSSRKNEKKSNSVKFYYFPKNSTLMPWLCEKRKKWINAVNQLKHQNDWLPSTNSTICSAHFIGNKKSENPLDPAYIPTIFPGETNNLQKLVKKLQRFERHQPREQQAEFVDINTVMNSLEFSTEANVQPERLAKRSVGCQSDDLSRGDQTSNTVLSCCLININGVCTAETQTNVISKKMADKSCEVDILTTAKVKKEFSSDPVDQHPQMLLCQGFRGITSLKTEENLISSTGGPPPLITVPIKDELSPIKRENSDSDSPSPKRQRLISGTEHTDDETINPMPSIIKSESIQDWQHGNLRVYEPQDIKAERVVGWGMRSGSRSTSRDASDDEWADAPADIGSFLHTKLRVDGNNSADKDTKESVPTRQSAAASSSSSAAELRVELTKAQLSMRPSTSPKSGPTDPRFTDVVKLSDYLKRGTRPQFWEESSVRRVLESVHLKELEKKQAAEILGVRYRTLSGRYRDVYGCIKRPKRIVNGPSDVLDRLQRGEMSLDAAAKALGVSINNLSAHLADFGVPDQEFEVPIEMDPSLKMRSRTYSAGAAKCARKPGPNTTTTAVDTSMKKILIGTMADEELPATLIATAHDNSKPPPAPPTTTGKWPTIRVASIDSLRGGEAPGPAVFR